jgi:nucleotide-binding universal stress UspA family protein
MAFFEAREGAAMITMRTVLVPYDGSEFSQRALHHAVSLARWYKAAITLLHVDPRDTFLSEIGGGAWSSPIEPGERKRMVSRLAEIGASARGAGVGVDVRVTEGRPITEIVRVAKEIGADLLVMGTHGRSGFDRLVLGSVTEKVLRHAPCPVLTVTARTVPVYRSGRPPFESLVCPVDFSETSLRALEYALSLAQEAYGRLTILHALEQFPSEEEPALAPFDMSAYHQAVERTVRGRLAEILPKGAPDWCKPEHIVVRGRAWRAILETAEARSADLIVMGIHGRNPVDLALFGSTTHHVVRGARCPVLVVRSGAPAS